MSYRCQLCSTAVRHGTPLIKHVTYRRVVLGEYLPDRIEVARETPVCLTCQKELTRGVPATQIARLYAAIKAITEHQLAVKPLAPVIIPPAYVEPATVSVTSEPIDF